MSKHCNIDPELGELSKSSFGVMKLGNATIGLSKLSELDEGSLRLLKLGEESFEIQNWMSWVLHPTLHFIFGTPCKGIDHEQVF